MLKVAVFTLFAVLILFVLLIVLPIGVYQLRDRPPIAIEFTKNREYSKVDVINQVVTAANVYGWKVVEHVGKLQLTKNELLISQNITIDCTGEYILPNGTVVKRSYLHQLMCDMDSVDFVYDICVKAIR